jgi:hypothetical protein
MNVNELVLQIIKMPPADQFDLAFKVAENVGYVLTAPQALAATPAVGILSREKSDRVLSECGYEPATPTVGGHRHRSELDDASNACLELCAKHGFATGHGDTVADMIREIDGQIATRAATPAVGGEALREAIEPFAEIEGAAIMHTVPDNWEIVLSMDGEPIAALKAKHFRAARAAFAAQPASPLRGREIDQANYKMGWWLAGALEDPTVCAEMKDAINKWFEAHQPGLVMSASSASPPEQPAACEAVANWMTLHGYATGHGDTLDDLLTELVAYVSQHAPVMTKETLE